MKVHLMGGPWYKDEDTPFQPDWWERIEALCKECPDMSAN